MRKLITKIMNRLRKKFDQDPAPESGPKFDPVIDPDTLDPVTGPFDPVTGPLNSDKLDPDVPIPEYDWRTEKYITQKEIEAEKKPEPVPDPDPVDPVKIEEEIRRLIPCTVNGIKWALNNAGHPIHEIIEEGKVGVNTQVYAMVGDVRIPVGGFFLVFIMRDPQVEAEKKKNG